MQFVTKWTKKITYEVFTVRVIISRVNTAKFDVRGSNHYLCVVDKTLSISRYLHGVGRDRVEERKERDERDGFSHIRQIIPT